MTNSCDIKHGFLFLAHRMVNMFGRKYFLDPETLRFEQVRLSSLQRLRYSVFFILGLIALAVILRYGFERYYPTPRQIIYERNNEILHSDYVALNTKLQDVESQLAEFRNRDDRFYRAILSLEPVPASIREAGTGGSETHTHLRNLREPGLVRNVSRKMDKISNKVQIQSRSLEDVQRTMCVSEAIPFLYEVKTMISSKYCSLVARRAYNPKVK